MKTGKQMDKIQEKRICGDFEKLSKIEQIEKLKSENKILKYKVKKVQDIVDEWKKEFIQKHESK